MLATGIERWKKVKCQLRAEGDDRKPILFCCATKERGPRGRQLPRYGEATPRRSSLANSKRFRDLHDSKGGESPVLWRRFGGRRHAPPPFEIHIGEKEGPQRGPSGRRYAAVNAIDRDRLEHRRPRGRRRHVSPNPYNVVISVMMLKEGWDVRNVKVIVPLRPCGSRTFSSRPWARPAEDAPPRDLDDGLAAKLTPEELYVIEHPSFEAILDRIKDIIEQKRSDEIDPRARVRADLAASRTFPSAKPSRCAPLFGSREWRETVPDWRKSFDLAQVPALTPQTRLARRDRRERDPNLFESGPSCARKIRGRRSSFPPEFPRTAISITSSKKSVREATASRKCTTSYQHKNAVKGSGSRVSGAQDLQTFPPGVPLSFDRRHGGRSMRSDRTWAISHAEGSDRRREGKALLPALQEAIIG